MRQILRSAVVLLGLVAAVPALAASLLPSPQLQFNDANGQPLAGGSVKFCVPNTGCGTLKNTFRDQAATQLNTNPVVLDSSGRATLYGNGSYDVQVRDAFGNLVFSGLTQEMNGALANSSPANSLLGNPTNVAGGVTSIGVSTPLSFSGGQLVFGLKVVSDSSNQVVDSTYAFQTRLVTGANPLTYTLPAANTLYNGFSFTVAAISQQATISANVVDKFNLSASQNLLLNQGQTATFTTNAANPGVWVVAFSGGVPTRSPGEVVQTRAGFCPPGTLPENGGAVSRSLYPGLFQAFGTTYGGGDGSTTFNLPSTGGLFNRGWLPSQSVDPGRALGSIQQDALQDHTHNYTYSDQTLSGLLNAGSAFNVVNRLSFSTQGTSGAAGARVASETRPVNIATLFCVATGLLQ